MGGQPIYEQLRLNLDGAVQHSSEPEPSRAEPAPAVGAHAAKGPAAHAMQRNGHSTILLVDDEEMVCDLTQRMLERLGYGVLTAHDGQQALEVLRAHQHDIVCALVDLTLPGIDGVEALRGLRQIRPDLPAIVSSGYDQMELDRRLAGVESCDSMQKPYELAELRSKLGALLIAVKMA